MEKRNATVAVIGAGDISAARSPRNSRPRDHVFAGRRDGAKLEPLVRDIEASGGSIVARSLDARKEDEVAAFLNDADKHAPLESASSMSAPMSTFRSWRPPTGCSEKSGKWHAGRLSCGPRIGALMVPHGKGNIFFTGATASLRAAADLPPSPAPIRAPRRGAVDGARARPKNIHVAHLIIDSGVDTAWVRERREQLWGKEALNNPDLLMPPASVAASYWQLYQQPRSAWTFELEIRPFAEKW